MQVVLMAAGLGSRLGPLTKDLPKALISVGGESLLAHAVRFAGLLAPSELIVVGGFCFEQVEAEIARLGPRPGVPAIRLLRNPDFRAGSILTLLAALPHVREDFVLLNVDHIFRPAIAAIVAADTPGITGFIDTDRVLGHDDMKVARDADGHILAIAKTLEQFDCGYVGMTRVPRAQLERYTREAHRACAEEGKNIHVERILARLAQTDDPPATRDISGHGWLEVDMPEERDRAEDALQGGGWR